MADRSLFIRSMRCIRAFVPAAILAAACFGSASAFNVTTYHYDNSRTGWNPNETVLTPASVSGGSFGVLATAIATGNIGAQPLIVQNVNIGNKGTHDVVYVVTDADDVEAFDATSGAKLLTVNLGTPPPRDTFPNPLQVGIESTPVIDTAQNAIYLVTCTYENNVPLYRLHKLDLGTLTDDVPSAIVSASTTLVNGTVVQFQTYAERQHPSLLEANGNIYVAFGSFADLAQTVSRGWLLGWNATTLAPLAANAVMNHRSALHGKCNKYMSGGPCFLSSIWMSQAGVAADAQGNLFFVTANSEPGTYGPPANLQESAIKLSGDLTTVLDLFTPHEVNTLDEIDGDFGSGGITLLPTQPGSIPNLAVAAGKSGKMYLLNRDSMGGHVDKAPDNVLATVPIGGCWCAESYFTGSDGIGRVVSSGGVTEEVWQVRTSPTVTLVHDSKSAQLVSGQDSGFFTTVSSDGTRRQAPIIWAATRPTTTQGNITLYALNANDSATLWSSVAGTWPNVGDNANVEPIVANGKVYVWGGPNLAILGLGATPGASVARYKTPVWRTPDHQIYGNVVAINGNVFSLKTRTGKIVLVDNTTAQNKDRTIEIFVGRALVVDGDYDGSGVFHSKLTNRAKSSPLLWYDDK
ncbi:MAG: hypothetical protein ABSA49_18640 [Rhizomicrobium sp.]